MSTFRSLVFSSVLVGIIAGVAISAVHFFTTVPLILQAEVYENAGAAEPAHAAEPAMAMSTPDTGEAAVATHEHEHEEGGWSPADGAERMLFTLAANVLTGIGYALVLNGLFSLVGKPVGWRQGLLWGLGGFAAVMLAPSLGLSPELPGTPAGPLLARQIWWVATVAATGGALALLAFQPKPWAALVAIVLIVAPHLIGAPQPPADEHALAPEILSHQFVVAVTMTSLLFWALLGTLSGVFHRRFEA